MGRAKNVALAGARPQVARTKGPRFHIPPEAPRRLFNFLDAPPLERTGHRDRKRYPEVDVAKLERKLLAAHPDLASVEAGFYPLAGTDAGIMFQILPGLRTGVAADFRPFWDEIPSEGVQLFQVRDRGTAWREWSDVAADGMLGPKIIGTLAESIEDFRLRSVTIFQTEELLGWSRKRSTATHGIVEFDQGPNTPVRRHVQLQLSLYAHAWAQADWVKSALARLDTRFLLIKAAAEHFTSRAADGVAEDLEDRIRKQNGFVLEGQHRSGAQTWELSGATGRLPGAWAAPIMGVNFGYSGNVLLHGFRPKTPRTPKLT